MLSPSHAIFVCLLLALRSHDQFEASHRSTVIPYCTSPHPLPPKMLLGGGDDGDDDGGADSGAGGGEMERKEEEKKREKMLSVPLSMPAENKYW